MKTNSVRAKLKQGHPSIGTWLTLSDPLAARMMARVGFDWLTVELEHTPTNLETAATIFALVSASGSVPLARVPWNTGENIKRVLDTGAWGIVVPMVNSRAEAEAAVAAARYAPHGNRSIGGQLHAVNFETDPATYYARANDEILVVLMAEHVKAIERADEILSVPGIDVVFIGPNDLHHSLGKSPSFESDDPAFTEALAHVLKMARKHGVAPGIHVADTAAAKRRLAEGFQFIAVASEAGMMLSKAREMAQGLGLLAAKAPVAKY
ncbi:MAG TPA: aldolase/citrate lyase family protein [Candidatus Acidoferrum sp.]|jgi:4-hydroxy-2-oxoheptanedioate aldolase|nr:aldolase/citrate lyase family protein [Candidatus Acidoferrum sp.]